jgi:hypothetical protein
MSEIRKIIGDFLKNRPAFVTIGLIVALEFVCHITKNHSATASNIDDYINQIATALLNLVKSIVEP